MLNPAAAPVDWTLDALLHDGTVVRLRPISPDDADRLEAFHTTLSGDTTRLRFFAPHPHLSAREIERFTNVDHHDREAVVALLDDAFIGIARYDREPGTSGAEVAFVVADAWQGTGVGSLLLEHLAARGRTEGLEHFVADTLPENRRMMQVFRDSGLSPVSSFEQGVVHLEMSLDLSGAVVERIESREHAAESRSIGRLLRPSSIAVIGAGGRPGTVGHEIVRSLVDGGFTGAVHPVNPKANPVAGQPAYPSISDIPGDVDLAIVAIPSVAVPDIVAECAAKGVHGLVVVSGGFAEVGAEGADRQRALVTAARRHGMRVIGPNCVGVINTDPAVSMYASFGAGRPPRGGVALASQSGAVGISVLEAAARSGLGMSAFVSLGNKADVSGNDLLQYWEDDDGTDVVLLYLESFGNPAKFARLARRIGRRKPILAVKSGRTAAGRRAATSHTAAMAADDVVVDALLHHCGVVRADTIDQLLDSALVLAHQPLPAGARVAIIGNSGGPGIMAADACAAAGLELATLGATTQQRLREQMGSATSASVVNPVDLLGDADPDRYTAAITTVMSDPDVDGAVVIHAPTLVADPAAIAAAIAAAPSSAKPVVAVLVGRDRSLLGPSVPVFGSVEPAVAALGNAAEYAAWRARPAAPEPDRDDVRPAVARHVVHDALERGAPDGWLDPVEIEKLLAAYGIPFAATELVADVDAARRAAEGLGYPVVLKASGETIVHKSEIGGVALGLRSADELAHAWHAMTERVGESMTGGLVQAMARPGVETIAGIFRDPTFGPLVLFGLGGTAAELLRDRTVRIAPVADVDAAEAVRSLRGTPLLTGFRGSEPVDLAALEDLVVRLGLLARDVPEVAELDLNPVVASPAGIIAVDARVRVTRPATGAPSDATRQMPPPRPTPAPP
ncbi:MAG TPA: GNAT family N-acetyltransferase [Acidimicrobiales bacterium]